MNDCCYRDAPKVITLHVFILGERVGNVLGGGGEYNHNIVYLLE